MGNIQEEVKDKVIDWIAKNAGGRLVIFKPEKSEMSLIVEKRDDYKKKTISLKIFNPEIFDEENAKKTASRFPGKKDFYMIFVKFDIVKQDIQDEIYIIPPAGLIKILGKNKLSDFFIEKLDEKKTK